MPEPTMDIIVNEGRDRRIFPGASEVKVERSLPEYRGGVTMTIRVQRMATEPMEVSIAIDPNLFSGVPSISGQWPISHILQKLADGINPQRLFDEFPGLTLAGIQLALEAAAWVLKDPSIDWASMNLPGMIELQKEMQEWQGLSDDAMEHSKDM